ncbi:TPA: hypothetical protein JK720_004817 [Escherichia coli]|nr:hypothetical protein [Escherichia coli]
MNPHRTRMTLAVRLGIAGLARRASRRRLIRQTLLTPPIRVRVEAMVERAGVVMVAATVEPVGVVMVAATVALAGVVMVAARLVLVAMVVVLVAAVTAQGRAVVLVAERAWRVAARTIAARS